MARATSSTSPRRRSGRVASPLFSVYAATKLGLGAFTEVLRKELHPSRVRVTLFEPGPTRSELGSHVDPEIMESLREDSFGEVEFLGAGDVSRHWSCSIVRGPTETRKPPSSHTRTTPDGPTLLLPAGGHISILRPRKAVLPTLLCIFLQDCSTCQ